MVLKRAFKFLTGGNCSISAAVWSPLTAEEAEAGLFAADVHAVHW